MEMLAVDEALNIGSRELAIDRSGMLGRVGRFGAQVLEAERLARAMPKLPRAGAISQIVVAGMGGSAIGADLARSYVFDKLAVPFAVNSHYRLPATVNRSTLLVVSSYSGETEETLSAYREGARRGARLYGVTSGGWLLAECRKKKIPCLQIPSGYPPRAALAFSFVPLIVLLQNLRLVRREPGAIETAAERLTQLTAKQLGPDVPLAKNLAKQIAVDLHGRLAVIYAGQDVLETVAFRWRTQIEENAKALASHHILPEMNHNEVVGWKYPKAELSRMRAIFLRDRDDHPRVKTRLEITKSILERAGGSVRDVEARHASRLARVLEMVHLGDTVSVYLALLYGEDPTPVAVITELKNALART